MNLIMFAAHEVQLIVKADIDQKGLETLRKDIQRQFAIKSEECYLIYDDQGGITVTIILREHDERNN